MQWMQLKSTTCISYNLGQQSVVVQSPQVLLPRFGLPSDPHYDPEEDWLDDNKGKPFMDFPNFFDALFEVRPQ